MLLNYEKLLIEYDFRNVYIKEKDFCSNTKGLCVGNRIALNNKLDTDKEKLCILAEELGHYHTTIGDIRDQTIIENRKQELRARRWGYEKLIPIECLILAFETNIFEHTDIAEFLNVTPAFLTSAIEYYKCKYGMSCRYKDYDIFFEPTIRISKSS